MPSTILLEKCWLAMIITHTLFYFFFCRYCLYHSSSSLEVRSKMNIVDWQEGTSEVLHGLKFLKKKIAHLQSKICLMHLSFSWVLTNGKWHFPHQWKNILELGGTVYNITQQTTRWFFLFLLCINNIKN